MSESLSSRFEGPKIYESMADLSDLVQYNGQKSIGVSSKTKNLGILEDLKNVKELYFSGDLDVDVANAISSLKNLKVLRVSSARRVAGVLSSKSVETLLFRDCSGLVNFSCIGELQKLRGLGITACKQLSSLSGGCQLKKLEELEIAGRPTSIGTLDSLDAISGFSGLKRLSLASRVKDKSLHPIASLKNLTYLWLPNLFQHKEYCYVLEKCKKLAGIELHNGSFSLSEGFVELDD